MKLTFRDSDLGYLQGILTIMLMQDLLGQDRYIEVIKNNWVPSNISGPIAFVLMLYIGGVLYKRRKAALEPTSLD